MFLKVSCTHGSISYKWEKKTISFKTINSSVEMPIILVFPLKIHLGNISTINKKDCTIKLKNISLISVFTKEFYSIRETTQKQLFNFVCTQLSNRLFQVKSNKAKCDRCLSFTNTHKTVLQRYHFEIYRDDHVEMKRWNDKDELESLGNAYLFSTWIFYTLCFYFMWVMDKTSMVYLITNW